MTRSFSIVSAILLCAGVSFGQAKKKSDKQQEPIKVFTMNKQPVYATEFMYLYKKNNQKTGNTDEKIEEYLNLFINFKLKVTEAYNRKMDTTQTFKNELKTYSEELKRPYRADTDDLNRLTKEAYQRLGEEIRASHILIAIAPDASPADTLNAFAKIESIKKRLAAGEDFEKLARELSEDPSAKTNGGSLGFFTAFQMVFPFEDTAYKLKSGEVSNPIRTRFGYHLIKVFERRPARGEIEVSHIIIRKNESNEKKARNTIFEVYDQLKGGRAWEELVKEYSEDPGTKDAGGRLRPFTTGALASVPKFEEVAFSLKQPGDISDPFQSSIGWHIIRLERKIPLAPFTDIEATLKRRVARDERVEVSKNNNLIKRKKQFGFIETDAKKSVMSLADSLLIKGQWKYSGNESLKNNVLLKIENKSVIVGEFVQYILKNQKPMPQVPQVYMTELYNSFVTDKLDEVEEIKLQAENPEYKNLLGEYREGILLFSIMEKEVWTKAAEDTAGQHKFYNENLAKYKAGDRVEASVFGSKDKTFIDEIKKRIGEGDTLTESDLRKFNSVQRSRKFEKGDSKVIDKITWSTGLRETEIDGTYYLVQIDKLILPGSKSFDEARANVISDYQDHLEKIWVAQLKKKYPVKINSKGKKYAFAELKKSNTNQVSK